VRHWCELGDDRGGGRRGAGIDPAAVEEVIGDASVWT
jgi:hypothetical protein